MLGIKQYRWRGIDARGKLLSGRRLGLNQTALCAALRKRGLRSVQLHSEPWLQQQPIRYTHITEFTQQLAVMLTAGIPLLESLHALFQQHRHAGMREMIQQIKQDISAGQSLSQSVKNQRKHFSTLYCELIHAGETSGTLVTMLEQLLQYRLRMLAIRRALQKALTYPTLVLIVGISVMCALLIMVVPQLSSLFAQMDTPLPRSTCITLQLAATLKHYGMIFLLIILSLTLTLYYGYQYSHPYAIRVENGLLKLPLLGHLLVQIYVARCARTLAITSAAGIPLIQALDLTAAGVNHHIFAQAIRSASINIQQGKSLYQSFSASEKFPSLFLHMIKIGECSGTLDQMLLHIARQYETKVNLAIDQLTTYLEPVLIIILCLGVGFFITAMYQPLFQLGSVI